jgi:hypothetical protein
MGRDLQFITLNGAARNRTKAPKMLRMHTDGSPQSMRSIFVGRATPRAPCKPSPLGPARRHTPDSMAESALTGGGPEAPAALTTR